VDLLHGVAVPAQKPGQPDVVGAGALHPERLQATGRADMVQAEREELGESGGRRR